MSPSIVLAGGGSAGHVSPMLALADCLLRRDPATSVLCVGTAQGLEARLVPQRGYRLATVPRVPMPRRPGPDLLRLPGRLAGAVRAAGAILDEAAADVVVGFGGYVCPPVYLAARRRRIPVVIHEQNPLPGLANRLGARLTPYVAVTFAGTPLPHPVHTGMPLRREIIAPDPPLTRASARVRLGLDPARPTLVVLGGSLGAQRLNETFGRVGAELLAAGVQVLHASGAGKTVDLTGDRADRADGTERADGGGDGLAGYRVVEYLDHIEVAYAAADLVVCRSGANTVCELTAVGVPAVYVPLPVGNGEQRMIAQQVVDVGGGLLVADADLTPDRVRSTVLPLLADPDRLERMGAAAAGLGRPHADELLADLVQAALEARPAAGVR